MSSTSPGYLRPSDEIPPQSEDDAFDAILQQAVVGMTGLPGDMVRPLWQLVPPTEPELTENWAAVGILKHSGEFNVATMHHGTGAIGESDGDKTGPLPGGWDETQHHEILDIMVSFYGPNSRSYADMFHEGLYVDQNRAMLREQADLGLIDIGDITAVPEMVNQRWRKRNDLRFRLYRLSRHSYPVRNLQEASGTIVSDNPDRTQSWDTDNVETEEN